MSYIFQFEDDTVWVTSEKFWNQNSYFDDRERGAGFPEEVRSVLGNISEACFQWRKDKWNVETVRTLLLKHGWVEIPS